MFFHFFLLLTVVTFLGSEYLLEFSFSFFSSTPFFLHFLLDMYSLLFISFIVLISSVVVFYSMSYMHGDPTLLRFLILVVSFVISMVLLVFSPSMLSIILGWDGLGVTSFLLVIYYNNVSSCRSGLLTIYTNRLGDVFLILGFSFIFWFGWSGLDLFIVDYLWMFIFVVLAGMTKSAQLPFSSWLPAAMAAPTPVSSLVHSSTLVTAGVYLFIRMYFLFDSFIYMVVFSVLFLLTSLSAGLFACFEVDLKKLVAMSTLSQLGLMMFSLSMSHFFYSFFHMITHALFKSLLFLCCGLLIMISLGSQDMRFKGNKIFSGVSIIVMMAIANLSLCGLPFLSGFFSKDLIVELSISSEAQLMSFLVLFFTCVLSVIYSFKMVKVSIMGLCSLNLPPVMSSFSFTSVMLMYFLCFWSISLGKTLSVILVDGELSMAFLVSKLMGLIFFGFSVLYALKVGVFHVFFTEMLNFNWLVGYFATKSQSKLNFPLGWEVFWVEMVGPKGTLKLFSNFKSFLVTIGFYSFKFSYMAFFFFLTLLLSFVYTI